MEIESVMTSPSSSRLLQNYRENWVGLRNIDDSSDTIERGRLKEDVFQTDRLMHLLATSMDSTPAPILCP